MGTGNGNGVPDMKADNFANNLYRVNNAIDYLSNLWGVKYDKPDEISFLLDIRTLIVHSGEKLSKIESLELEGYKDSQLGRILKNDDRSLLKFIRFKDCLSEYDYCIQVWNDRHSKLKKKHLTEVDYSQQNNDFYDISIYLKTEEVKNALLLMIENFLNSSERKEVKFKRSNELPNIKDKVIDCENHIINFEKISTLVSKNLRGGYLTENGLSYWDGFGLEKLYNYVKNNVDNSEKAYKIVLSRIENCISEYWEKYQDNTLPDDELPCLDIRTLFLDYTPNYEKKAYIEGQKLFQNIAPYFNVKDHYDATDIDYLGDFIMEINNALDINIDLKNSVDSLICNYIVQSVSKC